MFSNPSNTKMQPKTHQMTSYRLCYSRYRWVRVWARWGFWSVTVSSHLGQVRLMCHGQDTAQAWYISLVGGWPTPLKNMKISWDDSQYLEKNVPNHQPVLVIPPFQSCKPLRWPCQLQFYFTMVYGCMIQLSTMAYDGMRWYIAMKSDEINLYLI